MATPQEIDYSKFGAFAPTFQSMLPNLFTIAQQHDECVADLNVKEGTITEDDLEAARLRNKSGGEDVTKINKAVRELEKKMSELKARAWELVEGDVPQPLNDEDRTKVQARVKDLRAEFKQTLTAVNVVAASVGIDIDKTGVELPQLSGNAGRSSGTRQGHSGPRFRMDEVYVNGTLVQAPKPNKPEEMTSNLTVAANQINKDHKLKITASDLQKAYMDANNVKPDEDGSVDITKLPMDSTFTFTVKDGETVHEFEIRAKRS